MKKTGIWAARVGLLGIFFWCSSLFEAWLCHSHTPIEMRSGTMIWISALIGLHILLYISFSYTEKRQRVGWQAALFVGIVLMRILALLGTLNGDTVRNEVITIVLGVLPAVLIMHGLTQFGCNTSEYVWRKSQLHRT